jgi:hypothetical protein
LRKKWTLNWRKNEIFVSFQSSSRLKRRCSLGMKGSATAPPQKGDASEEQRKKSFLGLVEGSHGREGILKRAMAVDHMSPSHESKEFRQDHHPSPRDSHSNLPFISCHLISAFRQISEDLFVPQAPSSLVPLAPPIFVSFNGALVVPWQGEEAQPIHIATVLKIYGA